MNGMNPETKVAADGVKKKSRLHGAKAATRQPRFYCDGESIA